MEDPYSHEDEEPSSGDAFSDDIQVNADEECPSEAVSGGNGEFVFSFRRLMVFLGPGFLMSIAYLDPGNLESDIQTGSTAKYSLLWLLLLSTGMGLILQTRTINLGVVTGKHLAEHCRMEFPKYVRVPLWAMTEVAIIGSDIQEVLGSAIAINLLSDGAVPIWAGTLITAADTFTFLFLQNYGIRRLEIFFAFLISIMSITFGIQYFMKLPPQLDVVKGTLIPDLPSGTIQQAVGTIGSVIMPHNLYLHSALVLSRKFNRKSDAKVKEGVVYNTIESALALLVSYFINMFVVCNFAFMDYTKCGHHASAGNIGIAKAGKCMEGNYGKYALYVWAVGLLASGQSSTCTGTYAGQFAMQGFLDLHVVAWKRLLITRLTAIGPAVIVALITQANSNEIDQIQEWLNVLQSVQLPFAILPVMYFTTSVKHMGKYVNSKLMDVILWLINITVVAANMYLVITFVQTTLPQTALSYTLLALFGFLYLGLVLYLLLGCFGALNYLHLKVRSSEYSPIQNAENEDSK
eukprot:PhF_6_TR15647/c0_g1_i1/m.24315/K21398/SLC11A2, DMT1, NRAMP2; natural resistance-associated macrophage protein 2